MKKKVILMFGLLLGLAWFTAVSEMINDPKEIEAHLEKAAALEEKGIYIKAIDEYESALEYTPEDKNIRLRLANAYLQIGDSSEYVSICKEIAAWDQEDSTAIDNLMNYYVSNHDKVSAVKYLQEFIAQYPENDTAEKWLIELEGSYEERYFRYETLIGAGYDCFLVQKEEHVGILNAEGEMLLEGSYEEVYPYSSDGLALICENGTHKYVDEDGLAWMVLDEGYTEPGMLAEGRIRVSQNGKYGYLDEDLLPVTDFIWDELSSVSDGVGAGVMNGSWALLDEDGEEKTEYIYEDVIMDGYGFCCGQERIFVKTQGSYCMVDPKGKTVSEITFENARCFPKKDYAAVQKDGKWGFVNADGELMIDYQFEDAHSFQNGFAAVQVDEKWGYIDLDGHMAIEPIFANVTDISSKGMAVVMQDEWKLIQLNIFR